MSVPFNSLVSPFVWQRERKNSQWGSTPLGVMGSPIEYSFLSRMEGGERSWGRHLSLIDGWGRPTSILRCRGNKGEGGRRADGLLLSENSLKLIVSIAPSYLLSSFRQASKREKKQGKREREEEEEKQRRKESIRRFTLLFSLFSSVSTSSVYN